MARPVEPFDFQETLNRELQNLKDTNTELVKRIMSGNYVHPSDLPKLSECVAKNIVSIERLVTRMWEHEHPGGVEEVADETP